jgi:ABC-2 type transport system ATP-binding protein
VLLDASAQHAGRSGREVLRLSADTMGTGKERVEEMLTLVGLSGSEAKRRVGNYSLGMRQRLGIANALLGDPSVLILDEPVNGLDPAGIHWMRGLLRNFAGRGGTVLLSSHLLHEVEMIADEMVLIGRGKIVAQGTKAELLQTRGTYVKPEDPAALQHALAAAGIAATPSGDGGFRSESEPIDVGRAAAAAGVVLAELKRAEGAGLEEMFLQLTSDDARDSITAEGVQV